MTETPSNDNYFVKKDSWIGRIKSAFCRDNKTPESNNTVMQPFKNQSRRSYNRDVKNSTLPADSKKEVYHINTLKQKQIIDQLKSKGDYRRACVSDRRLIDDSSTIYSFRHKSKKNTPAVVKSEKDIRVRIPYKGDGTNNDDNLFTKENSYKWKNKANRPNKNKSTKSTMTTRQSVFRNGRKKETKTPPEENISGYEINKEDSLLSKENSFKCNELIKKSDIQSTSSSRRSIFRNEENKETKISPEENISGYENNNEDSLLSKENSYECENKAIGPTKNQDIQSTSSTRQSIFQNDEKRENKTLSDEIISGNKINKEDSLLSKENSFKCENKIIGPSKNKGIQSMSSSRQSSFQNKKKKETQISPEENISGDEINNDGDLLSKEKSFNCDNKINGPTKKKYIRSTMTSRQSIFRNGRKKENQTLSDENQSGIFQIKKEPSRHKIFFKKVFLSFPTSKMNKPGYKKIKKNISDKVVTLICHKFEQNPQKSK